MITPRFSLSQDTKSVTIVIRAPYCNLQELDVSLEENEFIFTCKPYYLRLNLPGPLEENDQTKSSFNSDTGEFSFQYEKMHMGENFENLEFITKFLCRKVDIEDGERKIDIISCNDTEITINETPETVCEYGFAMRGGYNFKALSTEFSDIFEVDPYNVPLPERRNLRQSKEKDDFDLEHYLADLIDNAEINEILHLQAPWDNIKKTDINFTPQELDFLKDLVNIEHNLNPQQLKYCHNGLLDILYSYCYDRRSTCFETTCESGWTISKLCATLSWFDGFQQPKETLVCAFRRSLIYPLFREFNFSQKIFHDLKKLIQLGDQFIIKCLIEIYDTFLKGDNGRYVFNNLFIKDYIIYVMKWDKELWNKTVTEINNIVIDKKDLGLNLTELEEERDMNSTMANLNISDTDSDDSSTENDSSYDSSTENDSSYDSSESSD